MLTGNSRTDQQWFQNRHFLLQNEKKKLYLLHVTQSWFLTGTANLSGSAPTATGWLNMTIAWPSYPNKSKLFYTWPYNFFYNPWLSQLLADSYTEDRLSLLCCWIEEHIACWVQRQEMMGGEFMICDKGHELYWHPQQWDHVAYAQNTAALGHLTAY